MEKDERLLNKIQNCFAQQEGLDDLLRMSEHWDGYKRENAVRRLGMLGNPIAIPSLLVRANDWVPQVRDAAMDALRMLMLDENAQAFIYSLPALFHLANCRRSDHGRLIANVVRFLLQPENVALVKAAIDSDDKYVARLCVRLCIDHSLIEGSLLVSRSLQHSDVVVRTMACGVLRDLSGEALESALQKAIQDPFMPIRREAFQMCLRTLPGKGPEIARRFVFDKHHSIRELAIMQLLKSGTDVEALFGEILSSSGHSALKVRCALLGVAHLGAKRSIPLVEKHVDDGLPGIRRAALQALAKLAGEDARAYLVAGLRDPSPGVARESVVLLRKITASPSVDDLLDVFDRAKFAHTLDVCVRCARLMNKWDRLLFLLTLGERLMSGDRGGVEMLSEELARWDVDFNRSSAQPSDTQKKAIWAKFRGCAFLLDEQRRRSIEFTVAGFGRELRRKESQERVR